LAPAIVKPTPQELLVVLNFHETRPDVKLLLANRLVMVRIFGNGVALCRRILP
jgi:hypothetical protein